MKGEVMQADHQCQTLNHVFCDFTDYDTVFIKVKDTLNVL
jgi:hypothetical protein